MGTKRAMLEVVERKYRKVSARVTPELWRSVGTAAAERGTTRELWVTEAITAYLAQAGIQQPPPRVKVDDLSEEDAERMRRYARFLRRMDGRDELKDAAEALYAQLAALAKKGQV